MRTCPNGTYAVVKGDGMRMCVSDCSLYSLIKDNSTNRCVGLY